MQPDPCFRLATAADIETFLPLFRAYQKHYSQLTTATEDKTRRFLISLVGTSEFGFVILAEADSRVVGFATSFVTASGILAERLAHLGDLYVDPQYRRRGIATALITRVIEQAQSRGLGLVRWLSLAENTELNRWYTSLGATSGEFRLFLRPVPAKAN